jgi:hypothetical protein
LKEEAESEEEEEQPEAEKKEDDQQNIQISPKTPSRRIQKIIHQNRSLGIWIQELKLRENYTHQNKGI